MITTAKVHEKSINTSGKILITSLELFNFHCEQENNEKIDLMM